jgi:hypothetical protein
MIRLNHKNLTTVVSLILILAITLVSVLVIWPKVKDIKKISDQIKQQKLELETRYQKGQNLKKAYENLEQVKSNQQLITSAVIKQGEELKFITALEETVAGKNIKQKINLSAPKLDTKNNKLQTLNLQISLEGNFLDILRAINEMERLNYYIIIGQLNFASSKAELTEIEYTGSQVVQANLTGQIYWLPNKLL